MDWEKQIVALRSDIERALDDLISNEEGMKFQGLAVVLAKKRWPELIACERKKDFGADAIASAPEFHNLVERVRRRNPPVHCAHRIYGGATGVPMRTQEIADRAGKQADGSAKTREAKLVTIWTAESRDERDKPVRDPGSITYSAAIESAATLDTSPDLSDFAARVQREGQYPRKGNLLLAIHAVSCDSRRLGFAGPILLRSNESV
jgi:hypothetical protein